MTEWLRTFNAGPLDAGLMNVRGGRIPQSVQNFAEN